MESEFRIPSSRYPLKKKDFTILQTHMHIDSIVDTRLHEKCGA